MVLAVTRAERVLWFQLPIGLYIVDFVNKRHMLIIEVDGATHGDDAEVDYDARRTAYLRR